MAFERDDRVIVEDEHETETGHIQISVDQFSLLLSAINTMKQTVMATLKREIQISQEVSEQLSKRVKIAPAIAFKKKGNEAQYQFNEWVKDKISETEMELEKVMGNAALAIQVASAAAGTDITEKDTSTTKAMTTAMEKAKDLMKEGRELIINRQKMIRLVDCSNYGWDLVKEY